MDSFIENIVFIVGLAAIILLVYLVAKQKLTKSRFLRFLGILAIGTASSLVPFGFMSLVFGFPAVLLSSILVSLFLDKE